jgi:hypothetical protein
MGLGRYIHTWVSMHLVRCFCWNAGRVSRHRHRHRDRDCGDGGKSIQGKSEQAGIIHLSTSCNVVCPAVLPCRLAWHSHTLVTNYPPRQTSHLGSDDTPFSFLMFWTWRTSKGSSRIRDPQAGQYPKAVSSQRPRHWNVPLQSRTLPAEEKRILRKVVKTASGYDSM